MDEVTKRPLRPYQEEALQAIRETVRQGVRRLVVQAPTGAGKTALASAIVAGAQRKGNRMCFVVPAISLVDQTVQMFYADGIRDIGVIQANHILTDWSKPVQVASIQTIRTRGTYPEAKVVIIDECHQLHEAHTKWMGILDNKTWQPTECPGWENVPFIGLSATPWTKGLGKYFQSLQIMSTTQELIDQGYLAKFRVFAADHPDLSGVKTVAGDYHEGQLSAVMQEKVLVANVIETWKERWNKDKTFCFGVDCAHAQMLRDRFLDAGIACGYQDAKTPMEERAEIKRQFHNGEIRVVCNVGTLTTGVDWDVRCLILARPTKSEMLFVQIIGRALRTAEGKEHAIILDHTDTTSRLGFVTDILHENLDGGKFGEKNKSVDRSVPLPKPCPQCACLIPPRVMTCPSCGFERKIQSSIFEREGELVELSPDGSVGREKGETSVRKHPYTIEEKGWFYAQLKGYGVQHGRKEGWAAWSYKEKFGVWPEWSIKYVPPASVGAEVYQWIRSRNIAYAKRLRAEAAAAGRPFTSSA